MSIKITGFKNIYTFKIGEKIDNSELLDFANPKKLLEHKSSVILFMSANDLKELQDKFIKLL